MGGPMEIATSRPLVSVRFLYGSERKRLVSQLKKQFSNVLSLRKNSRIRAPRDYVKQIPPDSTTRSRPLYDDMILSACYDFFSAEPLTSQSLTDFV